MEKQSYLTLRVARQEFVMDASRLRGFIPVHDLSTLGSPHQWLLGFTALGGRDLPVVDLRAKMALAQGSRGKAPCIVVIESTDGRLVGFVADRVSEIIELRARDFAGDAARVNGRKRRVLDPGCVMNDADFSEVWPAALLG